MAVRLRRAGQQIAHDLLSDQRQRPEERRRVIRSSESWRICLRRQRSAIGLWRSIMQTCAPWAAISPLAVS